MLTKVCEQCDKEMKLIPAGVSKKTGKPYSAFWSCDTRAGGCGKTARSEEASAAIQPTNYGGGEFDFGGYPEASSRPVAGGAVSDERLKAIETKVDEILALLKNNLG